MAANDVGYGMMREVLTVQNKTRTPSTGGAGTSSWSDETPNLRGYVRAVGKGREYLEARQIAGANSYEVTFPAPLPSGLTIDSDSRMKWLSNTGTRYLQLTAPLRPSPSGERFHVMCAEAQ